jgi:putative transposase
VSDAATTAVIEQVHAEDFGVHGARKIPAELHAKAIRWLGARCSG